MLHFNVLQRKFENKPRAAYCGTFLNISHALILTANTVQFNTWVQTLISGLYETNIALDDEKER